MSDNELAAEFESIRMDLVKICKVIDAINMIGIEQGVRLDAIERRLERDFQEKPTIIITK